MILITTGTRKSAARPLPDSSTAGTNFRAVPRINIDHRDTLFDSLIFDEGLELPESPRAVNIPLLSPYFGMLSDVLEIFHRNILAFLQRFHYLLAYYVVNRSHPFPLSAGKPYQNTFGASRAFGLERSPELLIMSPDMLGLLPRESQAIGAGRYIADAQVHAYRFIFFSCLANLLGQDHIDIKVLLSLLVNQDGKGRLLAFQQMPLVIAEIEGYFQPALDCGQGHLLFVRVIGKDPLVIVCRGCPEMPDLSRPSFGSLGDPAYGSNSEIGCKGESSPDFIIAERLQPEAVSGFVLLRYLQDIIAGISKALESAFENQPLLLCSLEFAFYYFD